MSTFFLDHFPLNLSLGFKTKCKDPIFLPEHFRRPNDPVVEGLEVTDTIRP